MRSRVRIAVLLATASIVLGACSGGNPASGAPSVAATGAAPSTGESAPASASTEQVTVDWWHITTGDPGKSDFQAIADAYPGSTEAERLVVPTRPGGGHVTRRWP
ncbi:MAG: hypothetical protein H0V73_09200 [Chloroflexi bacterium]|nr:hypothetical protein [Chloroflexota bacterium]